MSEKPAKNLPVSELGPKAKKKTYGKSFLIRISILLSLLIALAIFGWRSYDWQRRLSAVRNLLGNYENRPALDLLDQLQASYGKQGEIEFLRARAYRHLNDEKNFTEHIRVAKRMNFDSAIVNREESLYAMQNGSFQVTNDELLKMLGGAGSDLDEVALSMCFGFLLNTHFEDINKVLPFWKSQSSQSGKPYMIEGMVAQHFQKWSDADKAFTESLDRSPRLFPAIVAMAHNKLRLNQHAEAVPLFREYFAQAPEDGEAKLGLANALIGSQKSEEAVEFLKELVAKGETNFDLRFLLGQTLLNLGEAEQALKTLEPLIQVWPKDVKLNFALSQACSQLGMDEKSTEYAKVSDTGRELIGNIDQLMRDIEANPRDARRKYELGYLMLHYSSRDSGRYWLEAALRIQPNMAEAHRELERYYLQAGDKEKASSHAKSALASRQRPQ